MENREVNGEILTAVEAYRLLDDDYLITRSIVSPNWQLRYMVTGEVIDYWYDLADAVQGARFDRQARS